MSERIITKRHLQSIKRQAKLRAREDKSLSYMQHLDRASSEYGFARFTDVQVALKSAEKQPSTSLSLYMQACQDAYFEL